ncbi:MAG: acetylpolyamine aminohydrolase [Pseudomonadota bacterium]
MKIFVPTRHTGHDPFMDYSDGLPPFEHLEKPDRVDGVLEGLDRIGLTDRTEIDGLARDAVTELHDADYIAFLDAITAELGNDEQYIPSLFHDDLDAAPIRFQGGRFCREIGTPIGANSMEAALNSAAAALAAAKHTAATRENTFALCRPPGHHAGQRRYGGYCIFNNAYIAASVLSKAGHRPVVLDIDYHLGDGALEFASEHQPYVSLHADALKTYPYMGTAGLASGGGISLTALEDGVDINAYADLLSPALDKVSSSGSYLILSLGFDLIADDYIQDVPTQITAADFEPIGAAIGALKMPVTMVLEGGYNKGRLAECTRAFFQGFMPMRV